MEVDSPIKQGPLLVTEAGSGDDEVLFGFGPVGPTPKSGQIGPRADSCQVCYV